MLTQEQIQALKAPFPDAALSNDTSRGFTLTTAHYPLPTTHA